MRYQTVPLQVSTLRIQTGRLKALQESARAMVAP